MAGVISARVAILGCGKMGAAMAERLLVTGEESVICWNRSLERGMKAAREAMTGAKRGAVVTAPTPKQALGALLASSAAGPKAVLLVVSDAKAATQVLDAMDLGGLNLKHSMPVTLANLTSGSPDQGREMRQKWPSKSYVDACYCGPPTAVRAGSGQIFASVDDEETLDEARPLLEALAADVTYAGPIGASRALDYAVVDLALVNYLSFCSNAALLDREGVSYETFLTHAQKRLAAVPAALEAAHKRMDDPKLTYFKDPVVTLGTLRNFWASRLPYCEKAGLPQQHLANFVVDLLDTAGASDDKLQHADVTRLQEILRFGKNKGEFCDRDDKGPWKVEDAIDPVTGARQRTLKIPLTFDDFDDPLDDKGGKKKDGGAKKTTDGDDDDKKR